MVVQELQAENNTGGIEAGARLIEHLLVDMHHEIAAIRVLHHEANVFGRLKAGEQIDEEGMMTTIDDLEDAFLGHQALDLFAKQYVALLERLNRIILVRRLVLRQDHFAEVTTTEHRYEPE